MTIFAEGSRLGVKVLDTTDDATALFPLGTIVRAYNSVSDTNGEFIYVQALAAVSEGQVLSLDLHNKADLASSTSFANSGHGVGFAVGSITINQYGWAQIAGKAKAKAGTVAAGGKVMLTATAGTVDDAAIAGSQLVGAEFATADGTPAAGFAYVNCNRPSIQTQIT